jgi:hypothetical protein
MDADLALLEQKLAALIAHARALRSANAALNRELATTQEQNRVLTQRMEQASARLDALLERLPEN